MRTVERVLAEEGFSKLPRRTRLKIGRTVKGTVVPERSEPVRAAQVDGLHVDFHGGGDLFIRSVSRSTETCRN